MADIVSLIGGIILMLMLFLVLAYFVASAFREGWALFFVVSAYSLVLFGFLLASFLLVLE